MLTPAEIDNEIYVRKKNEILIYIISILIGMIIGFMLILPLKYYENKIIYYEKYIINVVKARLC
jgi:hypothetical protein